LFSENKELITRAIEFINSILNGDAFEKNGAVHPKLSKLDEIVQEFFKGCQNNSSKVIVFT